MTQSIGEKRFDPVFIFALVKNIIKSMYHVTNQESLMHL